MSFSEAIHGPWSYYSQAECRRHITGSQSLGVIHLLVSQRPPRGLQKSDHSCEFGNKSTYLGPPHPSAWLADSSALSPGQKVPQQPDWDPVRSWWRPWSFANCDGDLLFGTATRLLP
ncbi:hypothetical protein CONLIGDRAFT_107900 [Coniochaeta ligniaria NRRL 30616]|uniref:Uncharacterized protein n=1 Tax=Coniochaeta ligniaria NRRL 30616 TaxID=1408157 RepID=A0A1J7IT04_9PEZI|nr:hypothetical protein CONLIGDRAFT_107900 [Coniochaeta ligniaria NRRL 30616]